MGVRDHDRRVRLKGLLAEHASVVCAYARRRTAARADRLTERLSDTARLQTRVGGGDGSPAVALDGLAESDRELLLLIAWEGSSVQQAASVRDCPQPLIDLVWAKLEEQDRLGQRPSRGSGSRDPAVPAFMAVTTTLDFRILGGAAKPPTWFEARVRDLFALNAIATVSAAASRPVL